MIAGAFVTVMFIWQTSRALRYAQNLNSTSPQVGVTLIKPVYGANIYTEANFESWLKQNNSGNIQYIFSFQDPSDPALVIAKKLQERFQFEIIVNPVLTGYSGKTSNLYFALQKAKHELVIFSDSDISAPPETISKIVSQLNNFDIVSCVVMHTEAQNIWAKIYATVWNAVTVALVPCVILKKTFPALAGGTIGIRQDALKRIGGLSAIASYIAEDGALSIRAHQENLKVGLGPILTSPIAKMKFSDLWHKLVRGSLIGLKMNPNGFFATVASYVFLYLFWILIFASLVFQNYTSLVLSLMIFLLRLFQASYVSSVCTQKTRCAYEMVLADFFSVCALVVAMFRPYVYWGPIKFKVLKGGVLQKILP